MRAYAVIGIVSVSISLIGSSQGEQSDLGPIDLAVHAHIEADSIRLQVVLRPATTIVIYCPERSCLGQTVGEWLHVVFVSDRGDRYEVQHRTSRMWPEPKAVRRIAPGEAVSTEFSIQLGERYYFRAVDGRVLFRLPPGKYDVRASLDVPRKGPAARLGLTPMRLSGTAQEVQVPGLVGGQDRLIPQMDALDTYYGQILGCVCTHVREGRGTEPKDPTIVVIGEIRSVWLLGIEGLFSDSAKAGRLSRVAERISLGELDTGSEGRCKFEALPEETLRDRLTQETADTKRPEAILSLSEIGQNAFAASARNRYGAIALLWANPKDFSTNSGGAVFWVSLTVEAEPCRVDAISIGDL